MPEKISNSDRLRQLREAAYQAATPGRARAAVRRLASNVVGAGVKPPKPDAATIARLRKLAQPKRKRSKPRRGRVVDREYMAWVHRTSGCVAARSGGCVGRKTYHHVKTAPGAQKDDRYGFLACAGHHLHGSGPLSIERLGTYKFETLHGINIADEIRKNQEAYVAAGHQFTVPLPERKTRA